MWAELGADWPPETTGEVITAGEVIVPSPGVPARRGLAAAFEGTLGSTEYRVIGAVLLLVIGALAAFVGGWWGVGLGLMIGAAGLAGRGYTASDPTPSRQQ